MSNRWKIAGVLALVVLLLFAFTLVRSCQSVDEPPREEDTPRDLQSDAVLVDRTSGLALPVLHPSAWENMRAL